VEPVLLQPTRATYVIDFTGWEDNRVGIALGDASSGTVG
jgi:hypothetical protein